MHSAFLDKHPKQQPFQNRDFRFVCQAPELHRNTSSGMYNSITRRPGQQSAFDRGTRRTCSLWWTPLSTEHRRGFRPSWRIFLWFAFQACRSGRRAPATDPPCCRWPIQTRTSTRNEGQVPLPRLRMPICCAQQIEAKIMLSKIMEAVQFKLKFELKNCLFKIIKMHGSVTLCWYFFK